MAMKLRETTQEELKYYNCRQIPDIAGTEDGVAIIVGGSQSMWSDYEEFRAFNIPHDIITVNLSSIFIPHQVKHIYSWHSRVIGLIKKIRRHEFPDDNSLVHCKKDGDNVDYVWSGMDGFSFSGLSAAQFAILMGYKKVVFIGVAMDNSGYFYKPYFNESLHDKTRMKEIHYMQVVFGDRVRSMSGNTREILGKPTKEWLEV